MVIHFIYLEVRYVFPDLTLQSARWFRGDHCGESSSRFLMVVYGVIVITLMHELVGYWGVLAVTYCWRLEGSVFLYQSTLQTFYELFSRTTKDMSGSAYGEPSNE